MFKGLFKPAWQGDDENKAVEAIRKLVDEDKLKEAYSETQLGKAKEAALSRIKDQSFLLAAATAPDASLAIKEIALDRLNSQLDLVKVLNTIPAEQTNTKLLSYVSKITNEQALAELAKYCKIGTSIPSRAEGEKTLKMSDIYDEVTPLAETAALRLEDPGLITMVLDNTIFRNDFHVHVVEILEGKLGQPNLVDRLLQSYKANTNSQFDYYNKPEDLEPTPILLTDQERKTGVPGTTLKTMLKMIDFPAIKEVKMLPSRTGMRKAPHEIFYQQAELPHKGKLPQAVYNNLLNLIAKREDYSRKIMLEEDEGLVEVTLHFDYSNSRAAAKAELDQLGNPGYIAEAYSAIIK